MKMKIKSMPQSFSVFLVPVDSIFRSRPVGLCDITGPVSDKRLKCFLTGNNFLLTLNTNFLNLIIL